MYSLIKTTENHNIIVFLTFIKKARFRERVHRIFISGVEGLAPGRVANRQTLVVFSTVLAQRLNTIPFLLFTRKPTEVIIGISYICNNTSDALI